MSACAGSLTDASRSISIEMSSQRFGSWQARNGQQIVSGRKRGFIKSISPAWSRWIAPGRIGFMSTQRLQDLRLAHCKDRAGSRGVGFLCLLARELFAIAAGRTAPPEGPARTATNSLSSDYRNLQPIRLVLTNIRIGSPPTGKASIERPFRGASPRLSVHPFLRRLRAPIRPCRVYR